MKVIAFDLGGTLMEYEGMPHLWVDYYRQGFEAINQKYNLGASEPDIIKSVEALKEYNPRVNYREKEYSPEYIFSKVMEHWKRDVGVTEYINTFFEGLNLKATIYPDTIPTLEELKNMGYMISALTDLPTAMSDELFRKDIADLLQFFDLYVSSQSSGFRKPNCRGLQQIAAYYNIPVTELVFVGDEEKDKKTAMNAGCQFIMINRKERVSNGIYSLKELITIIRKKGK